MTIIINPGTEGSEEHSEANALKVADYICEDLGISKDHYKRNAEQDDSKGYYGFIFNGKGGQITVDIPGINPDVVRLGEPWKSPRLYVDGSSWLYGYALGFIRDGIKKEVI